MCREVLLVSSGPVVPMHRPSRLVVPQGNLSCVECVACSAEAVVGDRGSLRAGSVANQDHPSRFWAKVPKKLGQHLHGPWADYSTAGLTAGFRAPLMYRGYRSH